MCEHRAYNCAHVVAFEMTCMKAEYTIRIKIACLEHYSFTLNVPLNKEHELDKFERAILSQAFKLVDRTFVSSKRLAFADPTTTAFHCYHSIKFVIHFVGQFG